MTATPPRTKQLTTTNLPPPKDYDDDDDGDGDDYGDGDGDGQVSAPRMVAVS